MIYHLHRHNVEHNSSCIYCNYQQIRRARMMNIEEQFLNSINENHIVIANEILNFINQEIDLGLSVLITNIATNTLAITEPILNELSSRSANIHLVTNLMVKVNQNNFGLNRNVPCEERLEWISVNQENIPENILEFNRIILIDDVYDSGCSFEIAKIKLNEIGFENDRIDLITILKI